MRLAKASLLLFLCMFLPVSAWADATPVTIGVLSHRGDWVTRNMWGLTADYLEEAVPQYKFHILPLDFNEVDPAVASGKIDFVLVNPGIYVNMEVKYRVSRIATLYNRRGDVPYKIFGGVIFTRQNHPEIHNLEDLIGRSLMAVDATSLGGFQMAWREMKAVGLDPYEDLSRLEFGGIHDRVVTAVRDGLVDAGTVRTDILERMALVGEIDLSEFRIINPQKNLEFPFAHSTRLYPEWPFSKVAHTPNELAEQVAVALLKMPQDHPAAIAGKYAGWSIPLDYQPVHELFKELLLPPYEDLGKFTLSDAISRYWYALLGGIVILLFMGFMTFWVLRLNRELKKTQRRLEHQHELILDSVADGIYGVDMRGNSTFFNQAAEKLTGWRADEVIGKNQHQLLHHTHVDGTPYDVNDCPVYQTFCDSQPRFISEDIFWRKDGSSFPVEYSSTPIKDEKGETIGSVVVFRDIAEQKQAEEDARQHQAELARVARLSTLGEMASGIAHELNQPLTAISTNAQASIRLLESNSPDTNVCVDVMDRIVTQADRAGEIIRQLRRFVRKEPLELAEVDINALVSAVVVLIRPELRRANVRLKLQLDPQLPRIAVQPIQIEQVILNLARNSIEALNEVPMNSRKLSIQTSRVDLDGIRLTVRDSGPGLKPELIDNLFDPFVTSKPDGMGLGLSISHGIIEAHGGKLTKVSPTDGGAEFSIFLPLH
ncbi:MAG: PhnD/SsuA/transferrin family substrate-binding protein [Gammaproteobacteria bacterium]|nr:PhnD/SsuA/transferrin family substrate-binding protein [Gammaproteobacteria bacterium]